jgi:hypothetical protein
MEWRAFWYWIGRGCRKKKILYRREEAQRSGGGFIVLAFWKSDLDSSRGQDTQYLRS